MKLKHVIQLILAPLALMGYGWYLGQLHQSGYDIAGILMFVNGVIGLVLAFILHWVTRKFSWHNRWYMKILTGVVSCVVVFGLVLLYARLHG
jgi:uncharacterized membrane protein YeaQ/YmgE (transglycosylase-associated protein family)